MACYVSEDAFLGLAAAHGFSRVAPDALSKFDAFVYHVTKSTLDLVSLVTPTRTVQPAHFASLVRIADLMREPVAGRKGPRAMIGGAVRFPPSYFGSLEPSGAYGAPTGHSGASDVSAGIARPASVSTYGASELLMMGGGGGGGGGGGFKLSGDALVRLLRDYRARTRSDVLVSEPAKARLKRVVELNVDALIRQVRRVCKSPAGARGKGPLLNGKALERTAARWVLLLR